MKTAALSLPDQLKTALALVDRSMAIKVISTPEEYDAANGDYRSLIQAEKLLDLKFDELQCVIDYKDALAQKKTLAAQLDKAKKYIKNQPMKAYDDAQEAARVAEERRLAAIAKAAADAETARLMAEQKAAFDKAEAARKVAEEQAKKARAAAAAAAKKGNEEAAEKARQQAAEALQRAADEAARAAESRQAAVAIQADAAATPAPVVVVEKTHSGVTRRKVFKYRLTTKDGRKFLKNEMTPALRLKIAELGPLPAHLFVLSPVLLNDYVDSQGEMAALAGVLEVNFDMV